MERSGHRALRKGRVSLPQQVYLLTATTLDRQPWFADFKVACAAAQCFADESLIADSQLLAWVLMPDHVHWLLQLGETFGLDEVVARLKSTSARSANIALSRSGTVWSRAYHDRALRKDEDLRAAARYLICNPVRAGIVQRVGDYPFWNAIWLL